MQPNVPERLQRLLAAIVPAKRELDLADQRLQRIAGRLTQDFAVSKLLRIGSHAKGTAVLRYSDIDLLAVFARDEARKWAPRLDSTTIVNRVRNSITRSYPSVRLRIDKQALTVGFQQGAYAIDVVPAIFDRFDSGLAVPIYLIPDGVGAWLATAPDLHRRYVTDGHARSGNKLRSLVRFLKWWAASRVSTFPMSSLYVEWFVLHCQLPVGYTYQESMSAVFEAMVRERLPGLRDPANVSDHLVVAAKTPLQVAAIREAAAQSALRVRRALEAEARGQVSSAIDTWSMVFNRQFPSRRA